MTSKLLIVAGIVAVLITLGLIWQQYLQPNRLPAGQTELLPLEEQTMVIETETLDTQEGRDATIDAENDRIDAELDALTETDFSATGLSNTELGL